MASLLYKIRDLPPSLCAEHFARCYSKVLGLGHSRSSVVKGAACRSPLVPWRAFNGAWRCHSQYLCTRPSLPSLSLAHSSSAHQLNRWQAQSSPWQKTHSGIGRNTETFSRPQLLCCCNFLLLRLLLGVSVVSLLPIGLTLETFMTPPLVSSGFPFPFFPSSTSCIISSKAGNRTLIEIKDLC